MSTSSRRTPRKRPKQARRITSQALLAAVPDMMFRMTVDGVYLDFKPAAGLRPFRPPEEMIGKRITEILPKDVAEGALPLFELAASTGEPQTYSYQLPLDDGVHSYEARIVSLGAGEVLVISRDLTARVRHYGLTSRELDVLRLVTAGITDKEIADRLKISALTVRKHVASIRKKMHAASRTQAAVTALREGLVR